MDIPAKMRDCIVLREGWGAVYCELFAGFEPPIERGEKSKTRNVAGDGPTGCRETV